MVCSLVTLWVDGISFGNEVKIVFSILANFSEKDHEILLRIVQKYKKNMIYYQKAEIK